MTDAVETMAYAKESGVPWHGKGVAVEGAMTAEEAMTLAGLDWNVVLGKVYGGHDKKSSTLVPDVFSTIRETDGRVLGIVRKRYQPIQNTDVFSFMDSLVTDRVLHYDTAGSLHGGKQVWMLAQLDQDLTIAGDEYKPYLLGTTRHDGWESLRVRTVFTRVVCANTLSMALGEASLEARITHAGDIKSKMDRARELLVVVTEQQKRYAEWLEAAATTQTDDTALRSVTTALFGGVDDETPTQRLNAIKAFREIYDQEVARGGASAYALVNTVTGYADHGLRLNIRKDENAGAERLISMMGGAADIFKTRGLKAVAEICELDAIPV
jgi:phage/plasmid-like protein (TIGR03299 family)